MKILMIGVGYVGLVSATCFAEMGHHVTCLDIDENKIHLLKEARIPIYEPGLEEMVKRNIQAKRLSFTTSYAASVPQSDVCFIAVDTPTTSQGEANIQQVKNVAHTLGQHIQDYTVIVTKSTVPVGTTMTVAKIISEELKIRGIPVDFDVVSNPEFLKEGNAIQDFMKPNRVVIGVENTRAAAVMKEIYAPFMFKANRLLVMDIASSELAKYAANAMLATRISFMNEMSSLCECVGADINSIREAIGTDERIGNQFLYAGAGYGGSCFPKDIRALIAQGKQHNLDLSILNSVQCTNEAQKKLMGIKIDRYFESRGGLENKTIGILGLAFKPDTDDMREASSLVLIEHLMQHNVKIRVFDPIAIPKAKNVLKEVSDRICWCQDELEAAQGADALVLMTEWKQFRFLDFEALLSQMKGKAFFDGRNQYHPLEMQHRGFDYCSIGRKSAYANEMAIFS